MRFLCLFLAVSLRQSRRRHKMSIRMQTTGLTLTNKSDAATDLLFVNEQEIEILFYFFKDLPVTEVPEGQILF